MANLSVTIAGRGGAIRPVRDLSFSVARGETFCIVGESGCGKSMTSLALMGLLPRAAARSATRLALDGTDLRSLPRRAMADIRGNRMAMIFQEPMTSLNPVHTIGSQLREVWYRHRGRNRAAGEARALWLLDRVGMSSPRERLAQYPHELSGGLRQRVMIAMALMCEPALLIADEPTTALDVTIQAQILSLLRSLQDELGLAMIFITHDLGVVSRIADRVAVMYAGRIVETAATADIFRRPAHPYTRGLLECIPVPGRIARRQPLPAIPGQVPSPAQDIAGCAFANRCDQVRDACATARPPEAGVAAGHLVQCVLYGQAGSELSCPS
ncbi:ABC transporter ATP-binding protein [Chelatococcus reniformis]|uniref:ABC transporter ATP-binding protein n=1 Tax=Chelatococcus reniformis TaxID=1494448 RepID=UPI001FCE7596|nr:ABC transporter ATP-binding protein [Chelatococcus reniformis]